MQVLLETTAPSSAWGQDVFYSDSHGDFSSDTEGTIRKQEKPGS